MKNKLSNKFTSSCTAAGARLDSSKFYSGKTKIFFAFGLSFVLLAGLLLPWSPMNKTIGLSSIFSVVPTASANSVYANLSTGSLTYNLTATTKNQITTNDDWSGIASVEGYFGKNLTATHGIDPQTVLGTEFANNALPSAGNTQVNANKGNPSAYNAGGVTEFDTGDPLGIGFQGNVQANPYLVSYLNTTGRTGIKMSYTATDLDRAGASRPLTLRFRRRSITSRKCRSGLLQLMRQTLPAAARLMNGSALITSSSVNSRRQPQLLQSAAPLSILTARRWRMRQS